MNVVKVDFRKDRRNRLEWSDELEQKHQVKEYFKVAGLMVLLSITLIAAMSLPFAIGYMGEHHEYTSPN